MDVRSDFIKYGLEQFNELDLHIKVYLQEMPSEDIKTTPHSHQYFEMGFLVMGQIGHIVEGKKAILQKGDMFCIAPGVSHAMEILDTEKVQFIQWDFMPNFIDENIRSASGEDDILNFSYLNSFLASEATYSPKLELSQVARSDLEYLVRDLFKEYLKKQQGFRLCLKTDLIKILVHLVREYQSEVKDDFKIKKLLVNYGNEVYKAKEYIDKNYINDISLQEVCEYATMSQTYFSFIFKYITGKTFIQYLTDKRISAAMEMLKNTKLSVTDIFTRVGYNDYSHFNKVFKKTVGIPPTLYRKSQTNKNFLEEELF